MCFFFDVIMKYKNTINTQALFLKACKVKDVSGSRSASEPHRIWHAVFMLVVAKLQSIYQIIIK